MTSAHSTAKPHDVYLDWLRGLAAVSVFVTHVRGGFFVKWSDLDPSSHGLINYLLFLLTRLGRESVIIFFVLSGYLVGGQALAALRSGRFSIAQYLVARASRLYTVVIPALICTAALDFAAGGWDSTRNGAQTGLLNLLFLQEIFATTYGSNAPFWSLSYEWWFYVLFGSALTLLAAPFTRAAAVALAVLGSAGVMLALKCPAILLTLPIWLAGALIRVLPPSRAPMLISIPLPVVFLCAAMLVSNTRWDWQGDALVGLAVTVLVYFLRSAPQPASTGTPWGTRLAAFSFSLYALHYPLNQLCLSLVTPQRVSHAGPLQWLEWTGVVLFEGFVCWVFYWMFERHTPRVRSAVSAVMQSQLLLGHRKMRANNLGLR